MKVVLLIALAVVASCYDDIEDDYDYEIYKKNMRVLEDHMDCYLDDGPCESVPQSVKPHLVELVRDACRECSDIQKKHGRQFLEAAKEFLPDKYQEFRRKYDAHGKYFDALEEEIANY